MINGSDIEVIFSSTDEQFRGARAGLFFYEYRGSEALKIVGQPKVYEFRMTLGLGGSADEDREHAAMYRTLWLTEEQLRHVRAAQKATKGQRYVLRHDLTAFDDNLSMQIRFTEPAGSIVRCLWGDACGRGNVMFENEKGKRLLFPAVRSLYPNGSAYVNPLLLEPLDSLAR